MSARMDSIGAPMSPDDIVYDIKDVGYNAIVINTGKRKFPVVKAWTLLTVLSVIVVGIGLATSPSMDDVSGLYVGSMFVTGGLVLLGFLYWMDNDVKWTPDMKTDYASWYYTDLRIPLCNEHLWHYGYRKAVSDLYREAKSVVNTNRDIHPEWVKVFTQMNVQMKELTKLHNANKAPVPTFEAYVKPIEIEKEMINPSGKYSLSELWGDIDD